jgi:hypothetical protein
MELARDLPGNDESFSMQVEGRIDMSYWTNLVPSRISSFWNHLLPKTVALAGPLLFISLVLFILCCTSLSQPAFRPETGTLIKDVARNGYGELIIHNNWTMDTVAVLTDNKVKPLMAVYIRSKDSYRISKIGDGSYGLYFTVGNLWDAQARKFRTVLGYYRYNPPLVFQTTETEKDIEYSIFELDLYEAGASNFVPEQFEFPDLG